jgi:hypothetical protein
VTQYSLHVGPTNHSSLLLNEGINCAQYTSRLIIEAELLHKTTVQHNGVVQGGIKLRHTQYVKFIKLLNYQGPFVT